MTEEELDNLASTYLDGEASAEEVALVEGDPALLTRVEEFRSLALLTAAEVLPDPQLRERQLAAALSAFSTSGDGETSSPTESPAPVIDLTERRKSAPTVASRQQHNRQQSPDELRKRRTMPAWLAPAAGLLVLLAGGGWLLSNSTSSNDTETAALEITDDTADDAVEEAGETAGSMDESAEDGDDAALRASSAEMVEEESVDYDADDQDAMSEAMEDDAEESDAAAEDTGSQRPLLPAYTEYGPGGVFDPTGLTSTDLVDDESIPWGDPAQARCQVTADDLGYILLGYLPVDVDQRPSELLLFDDGAGQRIVERVDESCTIVPLP